ncbi:MAG TPA: universal stress protein [Marmoricola sp.]|nr:universal stress protein [Marmoricola sp.]
MNAHNRPVVVGVDATDDGDRALHFAVQEALRLHRPLRVVHAIVEDRALVPLAPLLPVAYPPSAIDIGKRIVDSAVRLAEHLGGEDLVVDEILAHGSRREVVLEHAEGAHEIVLGRRHSTLARVATGSTTSAVAAHSPCPVVLVPSVWRSDIVRHRVVAGLDGSSAAEKVLDHAFEAAEARDATLSLLCAWRPEAAYDAAIGARVHADEWTREAQRRIAEISAGARADHPDIPVATIAEYELTATALTEASRSADLLVLGRTGQGGPFGLMLGSVTHALLRTAECPLAIVPVDRDDH